jgi:hypothetical protein
MEKPSNITCEQEGLDTVITRKRFNPFAWTVLVFYIVCDVSIWFWHPAISADEGDLLASFAPILHGVIGLGLTYGMISLFMNRTVMRVGQRQLRVRHGPMPSRGNQILDAREITRFYVKDRVEHRNALSTSVAFELWATMSDRPLKKLIGVMRDRKQAEFLQQALEKTPGNGG